jgi:hypothetical protein
MNRLPDKIYLSPDFTTGYDKNPEVPFPVGLLCLEPIPKQAAASGVGWIWPLEPPSMGASDKGTGILG